jgi:hypothetical protein
MFEMQFDSRTFDRALEEFAAKLKRPMDTFGRTVEDWFYRTEREQFDSQGAAGASGTWPRRSPATERGNAGRGTVPTLVRSGQMRDVLTRPGGLGMLIERTGDQIIFRLPRPAGFHQTGTRRMPQRKVVDPSESQVRRLGEEVARDAREMVRGLGIETKG